MRKTLCKCGGLKDYRAKICKDCRNKDMSGKNNPNYSHGQASSSNMTKEYMIWSQMKSRCLRPTHKQFNEYGGRGISVCKEWIESFNAFYRDMGPKPEGFSIERINNDGNYEPSNCKWTDRRSQNTNKRDYKNNKCGVKGIYLRNRGSRSYWAVGITFNKVRYSKEGFKTKEDAKEYYDVMMSKLLELERDGVYLTNKDLKDRIELTKTILHNMKQGR